MSKREYDIVFNKIKFTAESGLHSSRLGDQSHKTVQVKVLRKHPCFKMASEES
jgi:hypothetical protein